MLRIFDKPGRKRFCKSGFGKMKVVSMLRNTEARYANEKSVALFSFFLKSEITNELSFHFKSGQYPPYCQNIFKIISENMTPFDRIRMVSMLRFIQ